MVRLAIALVLCVGLFLPPSTSAAPLDRPLNEGFGIAEAGNAVWRWMVGLVSAGGREFHSEQSVSDMGIGPLGLWFNNAASWSDDERSCMTAVQAGIGAGGLYYRPSSSCRAVLADVARLGVGVVTDAGDYWRVTGSQAGQGFRFYVPPMGDTRYGELKGYWRVPYEHSTSVANWRLYQNGVSRPIYAGPGTNGAAITYVNWLDASSGDDPYKWWGKTGELEVAASDGSQVIEVQKYVYPRYVSGSQWFSGAAVPVYPYTLDYGPYEATPVELAPPPTYGDVVNVTTVNITSYSVSWAREVVPPTATPLPTVVPTRTPFPTPDVVSPLLTALARPSGTPVVAPPIPTLGPDATVQDHVNNLPLSLWAGFLQWLLSMLQPSVGIAERVGVLAGQASEPGRFPLGVFAEVGGTVQAVYSGGGGGGPVEIVIPGYATWPDVRIPFLPAEPPAWAAVTFMVSTVGAALTLLWYIVGRVRRFLGQGSAGGGSDAD